MTAPKTPARPTALSPNPNPDPDLDPDLDLDLDLEGPLA